MAGCPLLVFYGVRGSGEAFDDGTLGLGVPVHDLYSNLVREYPAGFVGAVANGYPAVPVTNWKLVSYLSSVNDGVASMQADLPALHAQCPDSYFAVAGYSQGADVVRRALPGLSSTLRQIIARVQLFGDPNWRPGESGVTESGDFSMTATGIATKVGKLRSIPAFPSDLGSKIESWCHAADPVCQGNLWYDTSAHLRYVPNETQAAAWRVGNRFSGEMLTEAAPTAYIRDVFCNGSTPMVDVLFDMSNQWSTFVSSVDLYVGDTLAFHEDMHGGRYTAGLSAALPPGVTRVWALGGTTLIDQRYVQAPAC